MFDYRQFMDFFLLGRHRLENIATLPLGSTVADAIELYGEPSESEPSEDSPEIIDHTFPVPRYHKVVASEWKDKIQSITFLSVRPDPGRDLAYVLKSYRGDSNWDVMEEGYWYQRQDRTIRLWCSAIPAIGVAFVDFLIAKAEAKTAQSIAKLDELPDITWVPADVVFELQRQFVLHGDETLKKLAERSNSIAVSPNGQSVFIVRGHHAYDVGEGFQELNCPPEAEGYAVQVVNCYSWSPDGSCWSKITLPRDARVETICFEAEKCRLEIRRICGGRIFTFKGRASDIQGLSGLTFRLSPHKDEDLWEAIEVAEAEQCIINDQ